MRGIEEQVCKLFTDDIFVMIKSQINFEKRFVISQRVPFAINDSVVFYVSYYGRPECKWCVQYQINGGKPNLCCSCKQYESDGIPCAHIFCVMKREIMTDYPKSMVMKRWTKEAGETTIPPKMPQKYLNKAAQVPRYSAMIFQCSQACMNYSFSDEGSNAAIIEFGRMNEESMKYKDAYQEDIPNVLELKCVEGPRSCEDKGYAHEQNHQY